MDFHLEASYDSSDKANPISAKTLHAQAKFAYKGTKNVSIKYRLRAFRQGMHHEWEYEQVGRHKVGFDVRGFGPAGPRTGHLQVL
jgi:hypothetical protein